MVLVIVGAGKQVNSQILRRNQDWNLPVEFYFRNEINAAIGKVEVNTSQCAFRRLENVAVLPEPPYGH